MRKLWPRFSLLLCLAVTLPIGLAAQAAPSLESLLQDAKKAAGRENFEQALKLYQQAKALYPDSLEPHQSLARIYSDRKLYPLALEEYLAVYQKKPSDYETIFSVAETYGLLNQDQKSIQFFETGLTLYPGDRDFVQSLSWMYFKVEAYQKGIDLLNKTIADHGTNRNYEMTLGTIYSNLYEYDQSRSHYEASIKLGKRDHEEYFTSIAYYNLSILDVAFYEYAKAMDSVQSSLAMVERPSGHLAMGELYQARMDFRKAIEAYEKSDLGDETPLSKFDLAKIYAKFGYFELALAYLRKIEDHKDESWMYNFGITKEKFQRDMHEVYHDVYDGQFKAADFDSKANPWEWLQWLVKKILLALQAWYHGSQFKELQIRLADKSFATANNPQGWWSLYRANKDYLPAARKYLTLARDFEVSRTAKAVPSYLHEEGSLYGDFDRLLQALEKFDPVWQKEELADTLVETLNLARSRLKEPGQFKLINELYRINPGALRQAGFSLPIQVNVYGNPEKTAETAARLRDYAGACGYHVYESSHEGVEYTLNLNVGADGTYRSALRDRNGTAVFNHARKLKDKETLADFFREMFDKVHSLPENE